MSTSAADHSLPTFEQVSAGGVVFKRDGADVQIVIVQVVPELRWQLPKGIIDEGETNEQAALREVREEAGVDARIVEFAGTSEYWFSVKRQGVMQRCHKFVHFFVMAYESGDVRDHDHEVAEARWVPIATALDMFAFDSDREIVRKASAIIDATIPD